MVRLKKRVTISIIGIFLLALGIYVHNQVGYRPYSKMSESDVNKITILFGNYEPYQLSEDETLEFIGILKDITIYRKDNSYVEYDGVTSQMFCIEKQSGKKEYISAANPFFIINRTGYRTKYEPCNRMSKFYHDMVENKIVDR